jgi:hypothetical protein
MSFEILADCNFYCYFDEFENLNVILMSFENLNVILVSFDVILISFENVDMFL